MMNPVVLLGSLAFLVSFAGRFLWARFQNLLALLIPLSVIAVSYISYVIYHDFGEGMRALLLVATGFGYVAGGLFALLAEWCLKKEPHGLIE